MTLYIIIASLITCFVLHVVLYQLSGSLGLLELPGGRKIHEGAIPLIGGIAIYLSCVIIIFLFPLNNYIAIFMLLLLPVFLVGVIDDIFDISAKFRLAFQFFISLVAVNLLSLDVGVSRILPNNFFFAGILDQLISVLFIVTLMNAINMMDGMDGVVGSMLLLSLLAVTHVQAKSDAGNTNQLINVIIPCLVIFLFFNLVIKPGQYYGKVFMGDAGSMSLGFFLAVHLIHTSQGFYQPESSRFPSCLWFVFLPLADMFSTLLGRIIRRRSPLKADRTHIHHILQRAGLHKHKALQLLIIVHAFFIGIGIWFFHLDLHLFYTAFLLAFVFVLYRLILGMAPRFIRIRNRQLKRRQKALAKNTFVTNETICDRVSV